LIYHYDYIRQGYVSASVCLFACLSVGEITRNYRQIFVKFSEKIVRGIKMNDWIRLVEIQKKNFVDTELRTTPIYITTYKQ